MNKTVIFTIPCAGGRAMNYERWRGRLDYLTINLEYPGHWERWQESLNDDFMCIADDFEQNILEYLLSNPDTDVFIVGHSMGALFAWILAQRLKGKANVRGIILIAMAAPSQVKDTVLLKNLDSDDKITQFIKDVRHVPQKTLSSDIFTEYFYPMIKSDFRMLNTIANNSKIFTQLDIPCLIMYSREDSVIKEEDVMAWEKYALCAEYAEVKGDHYFLYDKKYIKNVCDMISTFIIQWRKTSL